MKRISCLLLCLVMVISLAACAAKAPEADKPIPDSTDAPSKESTEWPFLTGEGIHTIALVSDTQKWSASEFDTVFDSFVSSPVSIKVDYVVHTGDIIQEGGDRAAKWQTAKSAIGKLDGKVPYGVLAGNHDQIDGAENPFLEYGTYFGDECYKDFDGEAGSLDNCRAHAQLVTIGSTDFIFVYVSYGPNGDCIKFANEMFAKYPDRVGVLCTHEYLTAELKLSDMGEYMLKKIVEPHENVKMVLCGHESAAGFVTEKLDDGREVLEVIADYQDAPDKTTVLYLQFDESAKTIKGVQYSPVTGTSRGYEKEIATFEAAINW